MKGSVFRRCACRNEDGRQLGRTCPRLGQRRHGTWYYVADLGPGEDGKRRQRKRGGFATKAEAEAAMQALVARAGSGMSTDDKLTTGEWLRNWLTEKTKATGTSAAGKAIRPATAAIYGQHVDYLLPHLGHVPLGSSARSTTPRRCPARLAGSRGGRVVGPTTLRRVHAALRSALNAAVRSRRIAWNLALHVQLPEAERPQAQPWSPAELGAFLDATAAHRLGPLFEVMATTGLRRGEALGLRWSDLDSAAGVIVVRQQLTSVVGQVSFARPKAASGEGRLVELDSGTLGTLLALRLTQDAERAAWGEAYQDHDLVFAREDGRPYDPDHVTKTFRRLARTAGLRRVRLHDLRHGAASLRLAAGVPIEVVSKTLGHSSITITANTYSHLLPGVARQAARPPRRSCLVPRVTTM